MVRAGAGDLMLLLHTLLGAHQRTSHFLRFLCGHIFVQRSVTLREVLCVIFLLCKQLIDLNLMFTGGITHNLCAKSFFVFTWYINLLMHLVMRQKQIYQLTFLDLAVRVFNINELLEVNRGIALSNAPFRYLSKITIIKNCGDIEPKVELGVIAGKLHAEVAPYFLLDLVQVEDEVLLSLSICIFYLLPLHHLLDLRIVTFIVDFISVETVTPLDKVENLLNLILFQVLDGDVEAHLAGERTQADRVEVDHFVSHVLKHAVERQVVVLAK